MPINVSLTNTGTYVDYAITGLGTTVGTLSIASDPSTSAGLLLYGTVVATGTPTAGTLSGSVSRAYGLYYLQAVQGTTYSDVTAIWHQPSEYRRADLLTVKLKDILVDTMPAINAAWRQFAAAAGYTAGTISTSNIYVGDRRDPPAGSVSICIVNPDESFDHEGGDIALGDFAETATRIIRLYIDLTEDNETDSREEERERLRDTLRSAIVDILLDEQYQTITDAAGWEWFACKPTASDTGEVPKSRKWFWASDITWEAMTHGTR